MGTSGAGRPQFGAKSNQAIRYTRLRLKKKMFRKKVYFMKSYIKFKFSCPSMESCWNTATCRFVTGAVSPLMYLYFKWPTLSSRGSLILLMCVKSALNFMLGNQHFVLCFYIPFPKHAVKRIYSEWSKTGPVNTMANPLVDKASVICGF